MLGERCDCALDAGRPLIVKRRGGLHQISLSRFLQASFLKRRRKARPDLARPPSLSSGLGGSPAAAPTATGIRLRTPGDSLGTYCTGESVPMTGERGIACGRDCRASGYSARAEVLP